MSNTSTLDLEKLYPYLLSVSLRDSELLKALRDETSRDTMSVMQIAPEQGQFMALLIKLLGARKALEIGTYTGYSSLSVALALPEDGQLIACDISKEWTDIAQKYWQKAGVSNKISLRLAPALETLDELIADGESNTFDFAFIDADKENYLAYYEKALELMKPGGLIVLDNVLWSGHVIDPEKNDVDTEAIREVNKFLHTDKRVDLSMLPLADGLTLCRKR